MGKGPTGVGWVGISLDLSITPRVGEGSTTVGGEELLTRLKYHPTGSEVGGCLTRLINHHFSYERRIPQGGMGRYLIRLVKKAQGWGG